jgi:hypothetical protein
MHIYSIEVDLLNVVFCVFLKNKFIHFFFFKNFILPFTGTLT